MFDIAMLRKSFSWVRSAEFEKMGIGGFLVVSWY